MNAKPGAFITATSTSREKPSGPHDTPASDHSKSESLIKDINRRLLIPISVLALIALITAVWITAISASRQDTQAVENDLKIIEAVLNQKLESLRLLTRDYTIWNGAVDNAWLKPNKVWLDDNYGPYMYENWSINFSVLFDSNTQIAYSVVDGEKKKWSPVTGALSIVAPLMRKVRNESWDEPKGVSGFIRIDDDVYLMGVSAITPEESRLEGFDRSQTRPVLVVAQKVDDEMLADISQQFLIEGLASYSDQKSLEHALAIKDFEGTNVSWLSWTPNRPGQDWYILTLTILGGTFLTFALLVVKIMRDARGYLSQKESRLEEQRQRTEEVFRQRQKIETLGTLTGGIAHDFNNILTPILARSELALGDAEPGSASEKNLKSIFKSALRARDLVRQVLTFSRQVPRELKEVDIKEVAEEVEALVSTNENPSVEIEFIIEPDAPNVFADASQLHQVLMNLCTNALHAMPDSGVLTVCAARSNGETVLQTDGSEGEPFLIVTITDTGVGIAPDILARMWEPFFTTRAVGKGTGLGLAVVHGIVEQHGGTIHVESVLEQGTTFTLMFPSYRDPNTIQ